MPDEKEARIVEARMKLRERFQTRMQGTPAAADSQPQGSGPSNRHGMPKLPAGQTVTAGWPVLDLGRLPNVQLAKWELLVDGAVEEPRKFSWKDFMDLPQVEDVSDFHCVTTWSRYDNHWRGVRFRTIAEMAVPRENARFIL